MKRFLLGVVATIVAFFTVIFFKRKSSIVLAKSFANVENDSNRIKMIDKQMKQRVKELKKDVIGAQKEIVKEEFLEKFGYKGKTD